MRFKHTDGCLRWPITKNWYQPLYGARPCLGSSASPGALPGVSLLPEMPTSCPFLGNTHPPLRFNVPLPCGFSRPSHPYASSGPQALCQQQGAQTGSSTAWARLSSPLLPPLPSRAWYRALISICQGRMDRPCPLGWRALSPGATLPQTLSSQNTLAAGPKAHT